MFTPTFLFYPVQCGIMAPKVIQGNNLKSLWNKFRLDQECDTAIIIIGPTFQSTKCKSFSSNNSKPKIILIISKAIAFQTTIDSKIGGLSSKKTWK